MNLTSGSKKVVIVGDQGVGKTCILQRLIEHRFSSTSSPTVGTSQQYYTVQCSNGRSVTLALWDTAGQEQYHSLSQVYFRDSQAAVVVYDATKTNSVDRVIDWIRKYHEIVPDGFVAVAGNKSDLLRDLAEAKTQCIDIESEIGEKVALVSALNGDGVTQLFKFVAESISDKNQMTHHPLEPAQPNASGGCNC